MRAYRKGFSLIEVVVVSGIFGLFMTMVCHALVVGYRAQALTQEKTQDRRRAAIALSWWRREVATSTVVKFDTVDYAMGFEPASEATALRLTRNGEAGQVVVRYWLDADSKQLMRAQSGQTRVVATGVRSFVLNRPLNSHQVTALMLVSTLSQPLVAESRVLE